MIDRRHTIFQLPPLPQGQHPMDLLHFKVGEFVFLVVTALNVSSRVDPSLTRIFRMLDREPWTVDPEPILTVEAFHPRNIAIGPEIKGARWIWLADHGIDFPPYPGASSPLYRIHEDGRVESHDDPVLKQQCFSFDGAIWSHPVSGEHWLYQSNIGGSKIRLLKWDGEFGKVSDVSNLLPTHSKDSKRKFLVSRIIGKNEKGVSIFLGADTSDPKIRNNYEADEILDFGWSCAFRKGNPLPPRLMDSSWSTVEAICEDFDKPGSGDLLVLCHDYAFREGTAEILWKTPSGNFERSDIKLPVLLGDGKEEAWVARAAIGNVSRSDKLDIVLYWRATSAWKEKGRNNIIVLRNCGNRRFRDISEEFSFGPGYFTGGFFTGEDKSNLIQLNHFGRIEILNFKESPSLLELSPW
jgi:hypothetical protein